MVASELYHEEALSRYTLHDEKQILLQLKTSLWPIGYLGCSKEWDHFQQELMFSKMASRLLDLH